MTRRYVLGAVSAIAFTCSVLTVGSAYAQQRRDGNLLPQDQSGEVTVVGCLLPGTVVRGGHKDKYVLANPRTGPVASVEEASCAADTGAPALEVDNTSKSGLTSSMLG